MGSASRNRVLILTLCLVTGIPALHSQTFDTLVTFDGANGATPVVTPLVQGRDGNLYGTTLGGGSQLLGTVFRLTPSGTLTTLYSFCSQANCTDGYGPYGGLTLGTDGNFYGTTSTGGADGLSGTIFKVTPTGSLTTLHNFDGTDGAAPRAPMILARDGNFYGIAQDGGSNNSGTIFKITPTGIFTVLHEFAPGEGSYATGPLVQGPDGNFYGTTEWEGAFGHGLIFKVTPKGTFSIFYSFNFSDGSVPACGLFVGSDKQLYGTTYGGGADTIDCPNGCGTVFKISLGGTLTTLHSFHSTDGSLPIAGVVQATDGNFYGTTYGGGTGGGWGVVYEMTRTGRVTTIHSFQGTDGAQPYGAVAQATNGNIYGTATNGLGNASQGTVFEVLTGLNPFVTFVMGRGRVGQVIQILGQGFSGASAVSFNGTPATFTAKSDTFMTAIVPVGASSGPVQVTTPSGTLTSNVAFVVSP